ncbi:MAG: O-antigen ligase family protein [Opitutales bacterium]|nr:O-antigen ligase family protein [Opitutales bacterium]MCH8541624.1 O-antigen ligase family protein [Opitutales bacterium]
MGFIKHSKATNPLSLENLWISVREAFKPEKSRPPIPNLEKGLVFFLFLYLSGLLWAMGTTRPLPQLLFLIPAVGLFLYSLWPRNDHPIKWRGLQRLATFPVFWAGLVYAGIVLLQTTNPAWFYAEAGQAWRLFSKKEYTTWAPIGVEGAPFHQGNAWRALLILGLAWFPVCALWCGITRRRSLLFLAWLLSLGGLGLSIVVLLQILTGPDKLLWSIEVPSTRFIGPFIYSNHGATYFNLLIILQGGMALYYLNEAKTHLRRSDPSGFFLLLAGTSYFSGLATLSRGGFLTGTALMVLLVIVYFWKVFFLHQKRASNQVAALLVAAFALGVGYFAVTQVNFNRLWERFGERPDELRFEHLAADHETRLKTINETWEIFNDHRIWGIGAGNFRWVHYLYEEREPGIKVRQITWDHAHSDTLEYFAENGIVGMLPLLFMVGFWVRLIYGHRRATQYPLSFFLGVGCLIILLAYGSIDFPFRSPAILAFWAILLAIGGLFVERDRRIRSSSDQEPHQEEPSHAP